MQLMLESSARHWLKNLWRGTISSWTQFRGAFIENFKSTYKRPASLEELRHANKEQGRPCEHTSSDGRYSRIQRKTSRTKVRSMHSGEVFSALNSRSSSDR